MTAKDSSSTPTHKAGQEPVQTGNRQPTQIRQNLSSGKSHTVSVEIKERSGLRLNRIHLKGNKRPLTSDSQRRLAAGKKDSQAGNRTLSTADKNRQEHLQSLLKKRDSQDVERQKQAEQLEEQIRQTRLQRIQQQKEQRAATSASPQPTAKTQRDKTEAAPKSTQPSPRSEDKPPAGARRSALAQKPKSERKRRVGKLSIAEAIAGEDSESFNLYRRKSLAVLQRRREKEREQQQDHLATTKKVQRTVILPKSISVTKLAARMSVRAAEVVKTLMQLGILAKPTQEIDAETAELVVVEFGHIAKKADGEALDARYISHDDDPEKLEPRAPIITVMGHVDHGKTSLLDRIRKTSMVDQESGGITQHIGAYQVDAGDGNTLCFIDTPGHLAFSAMRARGADITDIVLLVVAADDGIQPQTREAIAHARAANKPMIVVVNKIDRDTADPDKIRQDLLSEEIVVESLSGDVQCVEVSAETGAGIDSLLEAIALQSEILELKADPSRLAVGRVLESRLDSTRGTIATLLVQRGTLKMGQTIVAGKQWGHVRTMTSDRKMSLKEATPSTPVEIMGLDAPPSPGDDFFVVTSESECRNIIRDRRAVSDEPVPIVRQEVQDIFADKKDAADLAKILNVFIKADAQGSLEAIKGVMLSLRSDNFEVRVIGSGVGAIKESDVLLAQTTSSMLIGFNVRANPQAQALAKKSRTEVHLFKIIYEVIEYISKLKKGMEPKKRTITVLGRAEVRAVFSVSKLGNVAGSLVTEGRISKAAHARVIRDDKEVFDSTVVSLRRVKDDVSEVASGTECGIGIERFGDIKVGDIIECYSVVEED